MSRSFLQRIRKQLVPTFLCLSLMASAVVTGRAGQEKQPTGTISGTIPAFALEIPDREKVIAIETATGQYRFSQPDARGNFSFPEVPPGKYQVLFVSGSSCTKSVSVEVKSGQSEIFRFKEFGPYPHVNRVPTDFVAFNFYWLTNFSELVVLGKVTRIQPVEPEPFERKPPRGEAPVFDAEVEFVIEGTAKGKVESSTVTIVADTSEGRKNIFRVGQRLLLFLERTDASIPLKRATRFYPVLPEGYARKLADEPSEPLVRFLAEYEKRSQTPDPDIQTTFDRLIEDVANPVARWDAGAKLLYVDYSLRQERMYSGRNPFRSEYTPLRSLVYDVWKKDIKGQGIESVLSATQKKRLADLLFATKRICYEDVPLLHVVRRFGDPRLVPFLVNCVHTLLEEPHPWTKWVVGVLPDFIPDKDLKLLVLVYSRTSFPFSETSPLEFARMTDRDGTDFGWTPEGQPLRDSFLNERRLLLLAMGRAIEKYNRQPETAATVPR